MKSSNSPRNPNRLSTVLRTPRTFVIICSAFLCLALLVYPNSIRWNTQLPLRLVCKGFTCQLVSRNSVAVLHDNGVVGTYTDKQASVLGHFNKVWPLKNSSKTLSLMLSGSSASPSSASPGAGPSQPARRPLVVLYWTVVYGDKNFFGLGSQPFSACPVKSCWGTNNRSYLDEADAVLFHGRSMHMSDLPQKRQQHQNFIFVLRESPLHTYLNLNQLDGFFNMTITYSRHADIVYNYGEAVPGQQQGRVPFFHRRRRPVAWMVSHCSTKSGRERYAAQLERHIPVDRYGQCSKRRCRASVRECYKRMADSHLFYLAFENSVCEDYITEKFWLALQAGMVPVVFGPDPESYRRVAPPHSFIHVQDFGGPRQLAAYLESLARNRTAYQSYLAWRSEYRVLSRPMACELCAALHQPRRAKSVLLSQVWNPARLCNASDSVVGV